MKEALRKFAHSLHPLEFEAMSAVPFRELLAEGYKQSRYASKDGDVIAANKEAILGADGVESAVIRAIAADGISADRKDGTVYVMGLDKVQDRLGNRIWLAEHVVPIIRDDINAAAEDVAKTAAKGDKKEKDETAPMRESINLGDSIKVPCATCKKYMEDRRDVGGKVWCKLWNTPVENVIQVGDASKYSGKCVPTRNLAQGQPDSGTNQWGNETPTYPGIGKTRMHGTGEKYPRPVKM